MLWRKKEPKTPIERFEEELAFWRREIRSGSASNQYEARKYLDEMHKIIVDSAKIELNGKLEKRLKSIEDAISDLYLTGKSDGTGS